MTEAENPFREVPDRELVIAFKAGDRDAYDEMYRRYSTMVGRVCRRMLGNSDDAQEATQETFLKAYQALPRFNGNYQLGAWIHRIASNVCVDHIRSRSRTGGLVPLPSEDQMREREQGPEDLVVGGDPRVDESIKDMLPLHARALMLRGVEGLSHKEMAGQLAMTAPQVKALLHRARQSFLRAWDNASGWALAPLASLRALIGRHSDHAGDAGSQLGIITPSVGPLLADKVAASAVIVAVALTGFGSVASVPAAAPLAASPAINTALRPRVAEARAFQGSRAGSTPRRTVAAAPAVADPSVDVAPAADITASLKSAVALKDHKASKKPASDDSDDDPFGPSSAGSKVDEIKRDISEKIPPKAQPQP
jgi:RNA polymerase sigma-70 factor (ECF subfamily)